MSTINLHTLPRDVQGLIFSFCSSRDIAAVSAANKAFNKAVDDAVWLRLNKTEFGVANKVCAIDPKNDFSSNKELYTDLTVLTEIVNKARSIAFPPMKKLTAFAKAIADSPDQKDVEQLTSLINKLSPKNRASFEEKINSFDQLPESIRSLAASFVGDAEGKLTVYQHFLKA